MQQSQHYLMFQSPDLDALHVAYLQADPSTRRAVDAATHAALDALQSRGIATSLEEPVEELAAALMHYVERSRGRPFDGLARSERERRPRATAAASRRSPTHELG